jgi:hypothetical protein
MEFEASKGVLKLVTQFEMGTQSVNARVKLVFTQGRASSFLPPYRALPGGIESSEFFPGLHKRLQIWAQDSQMF